MVSKPGTPRKLRRIHQSKHSPRGRSTHSRVKRNTQGALREYNRALREHKMMTKDRRSSRFKFKFQFSTVTALALSWKLPCSSKYGI